MLATLFVVLAAASIPGGTAPSTPEPVPAVASIPLSGPYCANPVPGPSPGTFT